MRSTPPALIDGETVSWQEMRRPLAEAAGGIVLEEILLERQLEAACAREGIAITDADVRAERELLIEELRRGGVAANTGQGIELLQQLRAQRGLGDTRFASLLRRTAMLRALVRDDVRLDAPTLRTTYALLHGERYRIRLITTATAREAQRALDRLRAGEAFGVVAAQASSDISAARGGIIEPLSPADPTYPEALRAQIVRTRVGALTDAIAIEPSGYAVALVEEIIPGDDPGLERVRASVERTARLQQERLLMNRRASRLLSSARIEVLDPALAESWRVRTTAR
ncbi:MAG: peptidyl-prolyl cis-trans isomerase [Planctomycetota bacterium]